MRENSDERPTIFDVAKASGVSITTVSHVFSGRRHVREKTQQRVLQTAKALGYQPSGTAQALAKGRTNTLALQISASGEDLVLNPFFSSLLASLSLAAIDRGFSFVYVPPSAAGRRFVEPLLRQRRIDGAVFVDPHRRDPFVRAVLAEDIPFVTIGRILGVASESWVDNDHRAICEKVVSHLAAAGYRRTALVTVPLDVSYVSDYTAAFSSVLGEIAPVVEAFDLSELSARDAVRVALEGEDPPDSLFCIHDRLAVGVLLAAAQVGLRVPEDLGVVGIGDSLAPHAQPPLTSVRVYPERAAVVALDLLDAVLHGVEPNVPGIVPARLVPRRSTARTV